MTQKTILVVEDNIKNLKLVKALLVMGEYNVVSSESAENGLELAREHLPELILMDIQLPGMNGLEATKIVKGDDKLKNIPVVALTSYAMEGDEEKALEAGCDSYMTKPIDTRNFLEKIAIYVGQKSQPKIIASSEEKKVRDVNTSKGAKILVVDDDPKNIKLMEGILISGGYRIFTAENGEEALRQVREVGPDLVLLDIMMPGIDGYEVTKQIKANPQSENIPIILVTALDGRNDKIRGMDAGAEEFLTKPVNPVEIEARVESMLKLKRYRDQLDIRSQSRNRIPEISESEAPVVLEEITHKVLIVEDDEKDLKLILSHLEPMSYNVEVARNGSDAIKMLDQGNFDITLVDILLPGMDGFQVCDNVKNNEKIKDTQVLLITSLNDLENRIRGVELGADDYLIKPYDPRELQTRMKALLKKKTYIDTLHSLYEQALNSALIDGLTGLYNHIYFKRFLELEIKRSERHDHQTALLMIDLDDFKHINDTLGHAAGDEILKSIGKLLKSTIREIDFAARYGGEEFVVVMPYGDPTTLAEVGNRICEATSAMAIPERCKNTISGVTVSVGGALYPTNADSSADLIEKADYMLYKAKRGGKNRLMIMGDKS